MRHVPLTAINFDSATQIRVEINADAVNAYAEKMAAGVKFPPAILFKDGDQFIIGDGWHRLLAAQKNGDVTFPCEVAGAGKREAMRYALSANSEHGLPRSNADKRKAVTVALREFPNQSDRAIADMCAVHHDLVGTVRKQSQVAESATCRISLRTGKDGKTYPPPAAPAPRPSIFAPAFEAAQPVPPLVPILVPMAETPYIPPQNQVPPPAPLPVAPVAKPAPWNVAREAERVVEIVARVIADAPAQHHAELKELILRMVTELCAILPTDAPPPPWGDRKVIPPLPEWVTAYSASIGYPMNGQAWCDHYEKKGWMVGKTKMKDWQAAVRTWRDNDWASGKVKVAAAAGAAPQRDYSRI